MEHALIVSELLHSESDSTPKLPISFPGSFDLTLRQVSVAQCPVLEFTAPEAPREEQGWNMSLSQYKIAECAAKGDFCKAHNPAVPLLSPLTAKLLHHLLHLFIVATNFLSPQPLQAFFFPFLFLHNNVRDEQGRPELTVFGSHLPLVTSHKGSFPTRDQALQSPVQKHQTPTLLQHLPGSFLFEFLPATSILQLLLGNRKLFPKFCSS